MGYFSDVEELDENELVEEDIDSAKEVDEDVSSDEREEVELSCTDSNTDTVLNEDDIEDEPFDIIGDLDVMVRSGMNGFIDCKISGRNLDERVDTVRFTIAVLTSTIYRHILPEDMYKYTEFFKQGIVDGLTIASEQRKNKDK